MKIKPLERDIRKLKLGDEFYIKARFVSATKDHVSILIGNDYGMPVTLRAKMGGTRLLVRRSTGRVRTTQ